MCGLFKGLLRTSRSIRDAISCFRSEKKGAAAVEFALLVGPFLAVIFASFDAIFTSVGEYLIINETNTAVRQLTTEQWTKGNTPDVNAKFCANLLAIFDCSTVPDRQRLFIDVRQYQNLTDIPVTLLPDEVEPKNFKQFKFDPGGPGSLNVLRVYYVWDTEMELIRPLISGVTKDGEKQNLTYLMMVTEIYRQPSDGS